MTNADVDRVMNTLRREMHADHVVYVDADFVEKILRRDAVMQEKNISGREEKAEPKQVTLEEHMNMLFKKKQ